jgi:hypothetical protein
MKLNWNPPKIATQKVIYSWAAIHAIYVHEGAVMQNGTVLPARRWTDFAMGQLNIQQIMCDRFAVTQSVDLAFRDMAAILNQAFTDAIESPIWNWPRTTIRRSGEIVISPRDAVDMATLRDSQSFRFEVSYG